MANRLVFMLRSEALLLDERQQASRRGFEAWILTSRRILLLESERKSVSSYWLLENEDNGSGKMAAHVGEGSSSSRHVASQKRRIRFCQEDRVSRHRATPALPMNGSNCHPKILPLGQMCLRASDPAHVLIYFIGYALSRSEEGLDKLRIVFAVDRNNEYVVGRLHDDARCALLLAKLRGDYGGLCLKKGGSDNRSLEAASAFTISCVRGSLEWSGLRTSDRRCRIADQVPFKTRGEGLIRGCGSAMVNVSDQGWHIMSSSPVPLLTRRVGEQCTLTLSRAQTSSRWCGVVVRREDSSSGVVLVT
ncbi:hypothetical protein TNCV_4427871 [Trichonephila clavipes]|nr:hypothetical protein TNCV_4427871 [Trichonephila clavipes]